MLSGLDTFDALVALAGDEVTVHEVVNGWRVDRWEMSDASIDALVALYHSVITGDIEDEIAAALEATGVDVNALFYDEVDSEARNRTTRADLCELAAAAAWVAIDEWPHETLHMPNVPKGSRSKSESGIDVLSLLLLDDGASDSLQDGEFLFIGSVKHTVQDIGDLRRKLIRSVSTAHELTQAYIMQQLRLFVGRLSERGVVAQRAFLFVAEDIDTSPRISIALTGAADATDLVSLVDEMNSLPTSTCDRACRLLLLSNIADLHVRVAPDG
jgi:hypothetical protein